MKHIHFSPLAGAPDVYVGTISHRGHACAAIIAPAPDGERWSFTIAGDVSVTGSAEWPTIVQASNAAAAAACAALGVDDPVDVTIARHPEKDDGELPYWPGDGPASWRDEDPVRPDPTRVTYPTGIPRPSVGARLAEMWKAWRL